MQVNQKLVEYVESYIFPKYSLNDVGHSVEHIKYVVRRSLDFAKQVPNINYDMVYAIAAFHDIGHHIDHDTHQFISAAALKNNSFIQSMFTRDEIETMAFAVEDHRASYKDEPRNIYGKIASSADRNVDYEKVLKRAWAYREKSTEMPLWKKIDESYNHICNKFGINGYATQKMYFLDPEYDAFLDKIQSLIQNRNLFNSEYVRVNHLEKNVIQDAIQNFKPFTPEEAIDKEAMLQFIDSCDDVLTRNNLVGHFSASAFVMNDYRTHTLLLHHNIMNDYIYPGGHADGEWDLYSVALREVKEETGLIVEPMFGHEIFAIQAAPVRGHYKNGKWVPAHIHYDVLFAFRAKNEDMDKIRIKSNENSAVEWRPVGDCLGGVAEWAKSVFNKILKKMED